MRFLCTIAALLLAGWVQGGEDVAAPKTMHKLDTALARAEKSGKQVAITLKVVDLKTMVMQKEVTIFQAVTKVVDGKEVVEKVPVKEARTYMVQSPNGYREIKLSGKDVKVTDLAGKTVPAGKLPELLSKFTPVLLHTAKSVPVDSFWLLTAKEGTLVFAVEENLLLPKLPVVKSPPPLETK